MRNEDHEDFLGHCEGCNALLFLGDQGFAYDDGPICCAECAPTWAEIAENIENGDNVELESRRLFSNALAAHLTAGGSLNDRRTWKL